MPRTREEFANRIDTCVERLIATAQDYETQLTNIAPLYQSLKASMKGNVSPSFLYALGDIRSQLDGLFEIGFLRLTPYQQLRHFPRYLKAIAVRQEKLTGGYQKDKIQMADYQIHWQLIQDVLQGNHRQSRWNPEFMKYRWMMEELRVSIFAQHLGTDQPVSLKRMAAQQKLISD